MGTSTKATLLVAAPVIEKMIEKAGQLAPGSAGARLSAGRDRKKEQYLQGVLKAIGGGK